MSLYLVMRRHRNRNDHLRQEIHLVVELVHVSAADVLHNVDRPVVEVHKVFLVNALPGLDSHLQLVLAVVRDGEVADQLKHRLVRTRVDDFQTARDVEIAASFEMLYATRSLSLQADRLHIIAPQSSAAMIFFFISVSPDIFS